MRVGILIFSAIVTLVAILAYGPVSQDLDYHQFADNRSVFGIPNGFNVLSNLPFLVVGLLGLGYCHANNTLPGVRSWQAFFTAVALLAVGSSYYHYSPTNATLVWDRLPMTLAFMGLFVALLSEHLDHRLQRFLLIPALLVGLLSVWCWSVTDDLRFYVWVQFFPLITVLLLLFLYQGSYSHRHYLLFALLAYGLAKLSEALDKVIFAFFAQQLSGHTIKHLAAACGSYLLLIMLQRRNAYALKTGENH